MFPICYKRFGGLMTETARAALYEIRSRIEACEYELAYLRAREAELLPRLLPDADDVQPSRIAAR